MVIPTVGVKGIFVLAEPLTNKIQPGLVLTCTAVRSLGDFVSMGREPFSTVYQPLGLTKEAYDAQALLGTYVATLRSESAQEFRIPVEYIISAPQPGGVAYEILALVASLGPIAKDKDLTFFTAAIKNVIKDKLGIDTEVELVKVSDTKHLDSQEAEALEIARDNAINDRTTDSSKLTVATQKISEQQVEIDALKKYIVDNAAPAEPDPETPAP